MQALIYNDETVEELKTTAGALIEQARKKGASAAEVAVSSSEGLTCTVRLGSVETVEHHRDRSVGMTVYFGQKKGNASSSDLREASLHETLRSACHIATYTESDPFAGLAPANLMAYHYPDLDLYHPWNLDATSAIQIATACEEAGRASKEITNSEGASLTSHHGMHVYANTHGFVGGYLSSHHSLNCALIAGEKDNMQRDYYYTVARSPKDLETPESVGKQAAKRAIERLNARRLHTQKVPVLFLAEVAGSLWGHFFSAISGSAIYRKSTFLMESKDQKIFPEHITVTEKPHIKKGMGSAPFDAEGVKTRNKVWIQNGVVQQYVLNSYYARKLGMKTTGNAGGLHNIRITTSPLDLNQLFQKMGKGLLVTELMGHGINKVTGDYSRGAVGFWVENGTIQYPVHEVTIAGNLKDMYKHIVLVGSDVDRRGNIHSGSILIESMTVAGH